MESNKYITYILHLIISYKMLLITGISDEQTNELTIYRILCWNVTIFYGQVQEKLKAYRSSKLDFSSSFFIANNSHIKIIWLHVVVFSRHYILHFWNNAHLFKYYPVKVPQNCFNFFNYSSQNCIQGCKFFFALGN